MSGLVIDPLASLERYLDATAVSSPSDLAGRIGARLLLEPPSTAPRRFLAALRALEFHGMLRGLGQNAVTAFRPGTGSMLLRAQAMAIVIVATATVSFGSVAGLAASQQVAQQLAAEFAGWSSKGSIKAPAAPGVPAARSVEQPEVQQAADGPDGLAHEDLPGSVAAPGQACGLPAHAEADQLQGSDGERCPDDPGNPVGAQGKADPPAAKGSDQGKADPPAAKGSAQGKADPPAAQGSDRGTKTPATDDKARASDKGTVPAPKAKRREGDRRRG